ncbi:MAG TPA: Arm DNA-binding domain-containing protein [Candidatus Binatia bacterium]|nr:Arm DNA-binding domain-containing protein [Candidatus Binatia bacterium]
MRVTLTDRSLSKLAAPTSGQIDYFDKTVPGFALRVSANGARSWIVRYRRHGRKQRVTLGPEDALSLADARAKAKDMLARVRLGEDPAADKRAEREAATFEELAHEYVERHAKRRSSSIFISSSGSTSTETRCRSMRGSRSGSSTSWSMTRC